MVIGLESANTISGLRTLQSIGYHMSIPVTPEQFAQRELRETWRKDQGMIVLKLWSDAHQRTPIDVFIDELFDFEREYASARWLKVFGDFEAPIVSYDTVIAMKRSAGRPQDLADIADLSRLQELKRGQER